MKHNAFIYSLKVWLTSVLAAPALFVLISFLIDGTDKWGIFNENSNGPFFYFIFVIFGFIFSFITWITFLLTIVLIKRYCTDDQLKKWLICFSGILLTIATFCLVMGPKDLFNDSDGFSNLMYANCACISWGVWFYKLRTAPPEQEIAREEPVS